MSLEPATAESPYIPRDAHGRFLKGAPGRPKGALNRMSNRVALALMEDFAANHTDVFQQLRVKDPTTYVRLVIHLAAKGVSYDEDEIAPLRSDPRQTVLTKGLRAMKAQAPKAALIADYRAAEAAAKADDDAVYAETLGQALETNIAAAEAIQARDDADLAEGWPDLMEDEEEDEEDEEDEDAPVQAAAPPPSAAPEAKTEAKPEPELEPELSEDDGWEELEPHEIPGEPKIRSEYVAESPQPPPEREIGVVESMDWTDRSHVQTPDWRCY